MRAAAPPLGARALVRHCFAPTVLVVQSAGAAALCAKNGQGITLADLLSPLGRQPRKGELPRRRSGPPSLVCVPTPSLGGWSPLQHQRARSQAPMVYCFCAHPTGTVTILADDERQVRHVQDFGFNALAVEDYRMQGADVAAKLSQAASRGASEEPYGGAQLRTARDADAFRMRAASTPLSPWFESYAMELMCRAPPDAHSFLNHPMACEQVSPLLPLLCTPPSWPHLLFPLDLIHTHTRNTHTRNNNHHHPPHAQTTGIVAVDSTCESPVAELQALYNPGAPPEGIFPAGFENSDIPRMYVMLHDDHDLPTQA